MTTNESRKELQNRLRTLLAIPERDRSDEIWDEIIELEIQLAPSNRIGAPQPGAQREMAPSGKKPLPNQTGGRSFPAGQARKPRPNSHQGKRAKDGAKQKTEARPGGKA